MGVASIRRPDAWLFKFKEPNSKMPDAEFSKFEDQNFWMPDADPKISRSNIFAMLD
jgi:hypothetical protein